MINKATLKIFLMAIVCLFVVACSQDGNKKVLTLAHGLDQKHVVHIAMEHMKNRLAELSGGELEIKIFPGGQLGGERELIELLQIGTIAMTKVSASPLESFSPQIKVFSVPYVFRDREHYFSVLDSEQGKELLHSMAASRLRGLGYYDAGSRNFYTTHQPIHTPSDLTGLKIRVQKSQTSIQMVEALGAAATPISWGELYTALQQGVVDGAENNAPSFYLSRHYEVSKFYTLDEHTAVPDILLIGLPVWKSLSPQQQKWLQQAADESIAYQRQLWATASTEALQKVEAAGVTIIKPNKIDFIQSVKKMHDSFDGTQVGHLIKAFSAINPEQVTP